MTDWKTFAIEKLKDYEAKRQALENLPLEIAQVESTMTSIRSARADSVPVRGGGSGYEEKMLNCIVQRDELQRCLERTKLWISGVERSLGILNNEERLILDRFYIHPAKGNVDRLCGELFLETSAVYKRREKALQKFTVALYGGTES